MVLIREGGATKVKSKVMQSNDVRKDIARRFIASVLAQKNKIGKLGGNRASHIPILRYITKGYTGEIDAILLDIENGFYTPENAIESIVLRVYKIGGLRVTQDNLDVAYRLAILTKKIKKKYPDSFDAE